MFANLRRRYHAFTLIELIAVVVVLGVLAALAVPTFNSVKQSSAEQTITRSAEAVLDEATALAAFKGTPLSDQDIDDALADYPGSKDLNPSQGAATITLTRSGITVTATINVDGTITLNTSGGNGGNNGGSNGGGNGAGSTYGAVTTVAAGTFTDITVAKIGPAQTFMQGSYAMRALPVEFTMTNGAGIYSYNPDWSVNQGYRVQPVIFDASGHELTDDAYMYNTGQMKLAVTAAAQDPTVDQSSGAPYYVMLVDYTSPNQASWYQATSDVFAGATLAFRIYSTSTSQLLGYTNRVAVNWG